MSLIQCNYDISNVILHFYRSELASLSHFLTPCLTLQSELEWDATIISTFTGIYTPLSMLVWTDLTRIGRLLHKFVCDRAFPVSYR